MISSARPGAPVAAERRSAAGLWPLLALAGLLALTGCVSSGNGGAPPLTTTLRKPVTLPARIVTSFFLVEAKQADGRTYRFMIDTGSHATLVTPALAEALRSRDDPGPDRTVLVRGAQGGEVELPAVMLKSLTLGDATFGHVPALIYGLTDLSGQLGMPLDAVIGFPLFRDLLLTLDYPGSRLQLGALPEPAAAAPADARASTIPFNNAQNSPLIPIQMGNESFIVLIDSGSDGALSLNPVGLHPRFANGPRVGTLVSSLNGERHQLVGRLDQNISIGNQAVVQPITDLTDQLSSLGGELLRNYVLTFDQRHNQVTFRRDQDTPLRLAARRSTGLSFARSTAYWKVLAVVPETPAVQFPVQTGDLCVRINGEPVEKWGAERYATLLRSAAKITYTFLNGPKETNFEIPVFELVP